MIFWFLTVLPALNCTKYIPLECVSAFHITLYESEEPDWISFTSSATSLPLISNTERLTCIDPCGKSYWIIVEGLNGFG